MTHYTPLPLWQPVLFKLTCAVPPAPARRLHRSRHRPRRELRPLPAAGLRCSLCCCSLRARDPCSHHSAIANPSYGCWCPPVKSIQTNPRLCCFMKPSSLSVASPPLLGPAPGRPDFPPAQHPLGGLPHPPRRSLFLTLGMPGTF